MPAVPLTAEGMLLTAWGVEYQHDRNQDWQEIMQFNALCFAILKDHSMRCVAWL